MIQTSKTTVDSKSNMAVKGASFGVAKGECFTLLGVNGAGKSSLFKCMMGLEEMTSGEFEL